MTTAQCDFGSMHLLLLFIYLLLLLFFFYRVHKTNINISTKTITIYGIIILNRFYIQKQGERQ